MDKHLILSRRIIVVLTVLCLGLAWDAINAHQMVHDIFSMCKDTLQHLPVASK